MAKTLTRTISTWNSLNKHHTQILQFMSRESKNIYNASIFHMRIYFRYYDKIFEKLYRLIENKKIKDIKVFNKKLFQIYDEFYNHYVLIKPYLQYNNRIIYSFIKDNIESIDLINSNYYTFEKFVIKTLGEGNYLRFPKNISLETKHELFYDIVDSILKSIYRRNFNETKDALLHNKKCRIQNETFIQQVKNNERLFDEKTITTKYKFLLKKHKLFEKFHKKKSSKTNKKTSKKKTKNKGIKSDQNYIARIIYKYYTNPKIPSDLMCNIIVKAFKSYSSFFALRKKGFKANAPQFLDYNESFILPFFPRSRKEVKINGKYYFRLTVGSTVADNFVDIIDDNRLVCIKDDVQYKLYVYKHHLIPIGNRKLFKRDNYFYGRYYIPKNSKHIIESYYIYIRKPTGLNNKEIKLIEIIPIHRGYRFKINFVYKIETNDNKPIKGRMTSFDLGMKNLMAGYDPHGRQIIIPGGNIIAINNGYNKKISKLTSLLTKNKKIKKA